MLVTLSAKPFLQNTVVPVSAQEDDNDSRHKAPPFVPDSFNTHAVPSTTPALLASMLDLSQSSEAGFVGLFPPVTVAGTQDGPASIRHSLDSEKDVDIKSGPFDEPEASQVASTAFDNGSIVPLNSSEEGRSSGESRAQSSDDETEPVRLSPIVFCMNKH